MISLKRDYTKTFEEDLKDIIGPDDHEKKRFQVVPLDYGVQDWKTPLLILSENRLIFLIDEIFEIYNLKDLEITLFGDIPKFTSWQQLLEGSFTFNQDDPQSFNKIRSSEQITRFAFNEEGQISKEFVLREGIFVKRNYQTWAMAQIILNQKNHLAEDPILDEIIIGGFSRFNQKTVLSFVGAFLVYFVFRAVALLGLPDILSTIFDLLFGIVLAGMLVWTILSINKNLDRYKATYNNYYSGIDRSQSDLYGGRNSL